MLPSDFPRHQTAFLDFLTERGHFHRTTRKGEFYGGLKPDRRMFLDLGDNRFRNCGREAFGRFCKSIVLNIQHFTPSLISPLVSKRRCLTLNYSCSARIALS